MGEKRNAYKVLLGKSLRKRHRHRRDDNIFESLKDGVQGLAALNRTMNFLVSVSGAGSAWGGTLESLYGFR